MLILASPDKQTVAVNFFRDCVRPPLSKQGWRHNIEVFADGRSAAGYTGPAT